MPEAKVVRGHSSSVRKCIEYLTKDGRALAEDYLNLWDPQWSEPVWQQMDDTRAIYGNDVPIKGTSVRTFEHIIISPDPRDLMKLDQLRELTKAWVEKYYSDYEVAVYYHDDNEGGLIHAHVVVNNTNLSTGRRLTNDYKAKGEWTRRVDDLQRMAQERGFHAFEATEDFKGRSSHQADTSQASNRTRTERSMGKDGRWSWKEDIRQRVRCAARLSLMPDEFVENARLLGIAVRENPKGEWVFSRIDQPSRKVKGSTLGYLWRRANLEQGMVLNRRRNLLNPHAELIGVLKESLAKLAPEEAHPEVLGVIRDSKVTAEDVYRMLVVIEEEDIRSMDDFKAVAQGAMSERSRKSLNESWRIARSLRFLPEHRDKKDGERESLRDRERSKHARRRDERGGSSSGSSPQVQHEQAHVREGGAR